MRRMPWFLPVGLTVTAFLAYAVHSRPQSAAQPKASVGLEQLKSLAGRWEGTAEGQPSHLTYEVTSGGHAILERLHTGNEAEMVTVYAADGDRLVVTHYCSAGNQPEMRTGPVTAPAKKFAFTFVRAANLASPQAGHMVGLTLTLVDPDHLTQEWTWREKGKSHTSAFQFTRKKT